MLVTGSGASLDATATGRGTELGACASTSTIEVSGIAIAGQSDTSCASAQGANSIAIGNRSTSSGIGIGTSVSGKKTSGYSDGYGQVAIGLNSSATASYAVAFGPNVVAGGIASVALGQGSNASGNSSFAGGDAANASGLGAIALGALTSASGASAVALGTSSVASEENAMALGVSTTASATGAVALGANALADRANTVSVGSTSAKRQIVNVAAGTQGTDAVNYAQLQAAGLKIDTDGNATNSFVAYDDTTKDKISLGGASGTTLTGVKAGEVSVSSTDAVNGSQLNKTNLDVAANGEAITKNTNDIAQNASDIEKNAGDITKIDSRVQTVEGSVTEITNQINNGELGLVQQDQTTRNLTVGAATDGMQISMAGTAGNRVVTGVAAGALNAKSGDAVNGSQLFATNETVEQNTSNIAKNADDIAQNSDAIAQNTDAITKNADAIDNVAASVSDITKQLDSGAVGLVQQDQTTRNLTVGAATDGLQISMAGTAGNRVVTGIADGTLSETSSDAVNGSQLNKTNLDVAANGEALTQNTSDIAKNTGDIAQNSSDIAKNADDIAQNSTDIAKNAGDITKIDSRVTNVEGSVSNITNQLNNGELGLVQQDQTSRDLMVASDKDGAHVNFAGTAGARELLGVAAGTTAGSAVNLGQLSPVVASLGGDAQVNADGSITGPTYHVQGGTQNTVGGALDSLDNGLSSLQTQISNGSIGVVTQDQTSRDILVGAATDGLRVNMAGTAGNRVVTGVAAGAVNASSSDAVNGEQLHANAKSTADALGGGSTVNDDGTISMPTYSMGGTTVNGVGAAIANVDGRVTQNTSDIASLQTTVGTMTGSVANAVSYDNAAHNQVTLGGSASAPKVKLTNLQDGELSATSTDAVTGSQLWTTNQQLSDLNQAVQNQQSTGSSALAIDTSGAPAPTATGSGAIAMGGGAQASGDNSAAIGAGSVADQANTVSVGSLGNERRITNVADGQGPTDAVNMRQFQSGLGSVARNAYSGVAAATALTMIPEVDPGKTLAVGVAGGSYKGYQAVALGASARVTANLKVKVGAGISAADTTYGAGASYQW
ncbi:YadA-like family protein [Paraburkholderia sp. GAS348]|uniref:YadA-like family protein n=1 Tax=Paraburkholderia sp. GAS348 TaxID=3035132 RepID=UPI003D208401